MLPRSDSSAVSDAAAGAASQSEQDVPRSTPGQSTSPAPVAPPTARTTAEESSMRVRAMLLSGVSALLALGSSALAVVRFGDQAFVANSLNLATLLMGGLLTFLFGLAAVVAAFRALGLVNREHPLGLPDGSIQAFIALFLILLFFIMSVFIYLNVSNTSADRTLTGLTEEQRTTLEEDPNVQVIAAIPRVEISPEADGASSAPLFDVVIALPAARSDVADEIARQLITTIGTLIVAIAAFYFGAKTVQETKEPRDGVANDKTPTMGP